MMIGKRFCIVHYDFGKKVWLPEWCILRRGDIYVWWLLWQFHYVPKGSRS
jgi:hypothetical protein